VQQALTQPSTATAKISDLWHEASAQTIEGCCADPLDIVNVPALQVFAGDEPVYLPINEISNDINERCG